MSENLWAEETDPALRFDEQAVADAVRREVRPTTWLSADALDAAVGARVLIASEAFQHTGSFKYRAAMGVALHSVAPHLLASSSGNFGAALALAAKRTGKRCTIVMPAQSAQVKIEAVRSHGASVDLVDTSKLTRRERVEQLARELDDAQVVSAYDDPYVIAGNSTLGEELLEAAGGLPEIILVPVGGGGLASGIVRARDRQKRPVEVFGAEPLLANDAARSLKAGILVHDEGESETICDGARVPSLGQRNFAILRRGLGGVLEVPEAAVAEAVRLVFRTLNLKVEPTGALAVAALLAHPDRFPARRVTCVVSGGNVDPALYARLIGP